MIDYNITGFLIFAFITSITPGPNNYLLFSFGEKYGFKDSSKLMLGILSGFMVLLYASGYGITELITNNPTVGLILKIASSFWLFYLAFAISKLNSKTFQLNSKTGFFHGFFMQFVNPKAWVMAITSASAFMPQLNNTHTSVFMFASIFGLVGIPCMITWIFFGNLISKLLKSEKKNRILGIILFLLMTISILMIWL